MIERMPTKHLVAMLKSAGPEAAVGILRSVPADRIALLLAAMELSYVTRLLVAAGTDQMEDLLRAVPVDRVPSIMQRMPMRRLVDLVEVLSPEAAARCLEMVSARAAAGVIWEVPEPAQARLLDLVDTRHGGAVAGALYERRAQESIVRVASTVWWLDQTSCDLLAVALNRTFQVAVRHRSQSPFTDADVDDAVSGAAWRRIAGLIVLTNVVPAASARARANDMHASGRRVGLLRWIDRRDDGDLKRTLVRVTS